MKPHSEDQVRLQILGDLIRRYRLRKRQLQADRPWAQEDLAVAIGSDKAHVNRLESGRQAPTRDTTLRICSALGLTWEEQSRLLSLAGHLQGAPGPEEPEIAFVTSRAAPSLASLSYPAYLIDSLQRIWDVNDLFARIVLGYESRDECLNEIRGKSLIELLSQSHSASGWLRQVIVDYEAVLRRHLALFRNTLGRVQSSSHSQDVFSRLLSDGEINASWLRLNFGGSDQEPEFLDHQRIVFDHPSLGRFEVAVWQSKLTVDERLEIVHLTPTNDATRLLFEGARSVSAGSSFGAKPEQRMAEANTGERPGTPHSISGPITIVVPWTEGGATDIGARVLAKCLSEELGEAVAVVNREGRDSLLGLSEVAASPPDGRTLAFLNLPAFSTGLMQHPEESLDIDSFTFLVNQVFDPTGVVVRSESPYRALRQMIEDARRHPGRVRVGTSGLFTPAHLGALLLEQASGVEFSFEHFNGGAEHMARFHQGETDVAFFGTGAVLPEIREGRWRALAMFTGGRFDLLPSVPSTSELGYPQLLMGSSRGIVGPRGVASETVEILIEALTRAMNQPEHLTKLHTEGLGVSLLTGSVYREFADSQMRLYRDLMPRLVGR